MGEEQGVDKVAWFDGAPSDGKKWWEGVGWP